MKSPAFSNLLKRAFLSAAAASSLFSGSQAFCQVDGPFDNVINIPTDPDIGFGQSIGGDGQTTQLNLSNGGSIGASFTAQSGVEVNIGGGTVGDDLSALEGSELNVFGGVIGDRANINGTTLNLSGGTIGERLRLDGDSILNISGGAIGFGGLVESTTINISDGAIGRFFQVRNSTATISGGEFEGLNASFNSAFNISGGSFEQFNANLNSIVTITGGEFGDGFDGDSTVNISGGNFGNDFFAGSGVTISGGTFGSEFRGTKFELRGSEFQLNGIAYNQPTVTIDRFIAMNDGDVFTGVLEDGSSFSFDSNSRDSLVNVVLTNLSGPTPVLTQVNGAGPSDPALFNTVINIPEDQAVFRAQVIGDVFNRTTQLNLSDGGAIEGSLTVGEGVEANISNGTVNRLFAAAGSELNVTGGNFSVLTLGGESQSSISGGTFADEFITLSGSESTISGGVFGNGANFRSGSSTTLVGGEFSLNGVAYSDSTISLSDGDTFTGVFQNGTAFIFSDFVGDSLTDINLAAADVPTPTSNNFIVDSENPADAPVSLRTGQTLDVIAGGSLTNPFESVGGTINVSGGTLGNVTASQSSVNLTNGDVKTLSVLNGSLLTVNDSRTEDVFISSSNASFNGSDSVAEGLITIDSGQLDIQDANAIRGFTANDSVVNISGDAAISSTLRATNSEINISDNARIRNLSQSSVTDSELNISGGTIDLGLTVRDSTVRITGGATALEAFSSQITVDGGSIEGVSPIRLITSDTTLLAGNIADSLQMTGGTLDVLGGQIGDFFQVNTFDTFGIAPAAIVNVSGGEIGSDFQVESTAVANISGGIIGDDFTIGRRPGDFDRITGGIANISGGTIGNSFSVGGGGTANISGGTFGRDFGVALESGDVTLVGGEFQLNGVDYNDATVSFATGDIFTGTLEDGSTFIFSDAQDNIVGSLNLNRVALTTFNPVSVVDTDLSGGPTGIRLGQTLTIADGGVLGPNFETIGGTINIEGGELGSNASVLQSTVNVSGGTVGSGFIADAGSEINLFGGSIEELTAASGSQVSIFGEFFAEEFFADAGSTVDIFASEFFVKGLEIDFDEQNRFVLDRRNLVLEGTYADGTLFEQDLIATGGGDFGVSPDAILRLNLVPSAVPEPSSALLLALSGMMLLGKRRRAE